MNQLHYAHTGVVGSLSQARESLYWPGMKNEFRQFTERCDVCRAFDQKQQGTFIVNEILDQPWAKVGIGLFSYKGHNSSVFIIILLGGGSSEKHQVRHNYFKVESSICKIQNSQYVCVR